MMPSFIVFWLGCLLSIIIRLHFVIAWQDVYVQICVIDIIVCVEHLHLRP